MVEAFKYIESKYEILQTIKYFLCRGLPLHRSGRKEKVQCVNKDKSLCVQKPKEREDKRKWQLQGTKCLRSTIARSDIDSGS